MESILLMIMLSGVILLVGFLWNGIELLLTTEVWNLQTYTFALIAIFLILRLLGSMYSTVKERNSAEANIRRILSGQNSNTQPPV